LKERDDARADAETLRSRVRELEAAAAGFDEKLQTIASHLASDHESDLGGAVAEREEARAEARTLRGRVAELEGALAEERERVRVLQQEAAEFDKRLQTIVTHLASDHETDLGQVMSEKEAARAEARALSMKLAQVQRKFEDAESLLAETRRAAQAEIDRLRMQIASAASPGPANRARVLVVHPDGAVRAAAAASLERAGYEVVGAADGLEALRVAIATQPEVVVAESSMPKMDGRELCQLLKSQEKTAQIRFVLLMRAGDDAPRGDFTPDEVLRKPVPVETLRATLEGLLSPDRRS
jgi:CheY-like chemotaxis protein